MKSNKKLEELKALLAEVNDLNNAAAVLGWDQATYMPAGGTNASKRTSESSRPTTAMASCRMSTGTAAPSAARSRDTRSAT